jgi:hypothetical protein
MNDTFEPNHSASVNAANFCQDVLGMGMWDVSRLFEQWACTQGVKSELFNLIALPIIHPNCLDQNPNTFNALRVECTNLINGGLSKYDTHDYDKSQAYGLYRNRRAIQESPHQL